MPEAVQRVQVFREDIPVGLISEIQQAKAVAWDIETSGLDWTVGRIGTCQLHCASSDKTMIIIIGDRVPENLARLLDSQEVTKIFHHAPFDLRWMVGKWNVSVRNVACTKVASRLLDPSPDSSRHTLQRLLKKHLGVSIQKEQRLSDWTSSQLTSAQVAYAAGDVEHLIQLHAKLSELLVAKSLHGTYQSCIDFLPTLVALEVGGWPDVFSY